VINANQANSATFFLEIIDLCEENGNLLDVRLQPRLRGRDLLTDDFYVVVKINSKLDIVTNFRKFRK
jgi:hypothetical protein